MHITTSNGLLTLFAGFPGYALALAEQERARAVESSRAGSEDRQSPSPTHIAVQPPALAHVRVPPSHQRKDSDTLRSLVTNGSPTICESQPPRGLSPLHRNSDTGSGSSGELPRPQSQNGLLPVANAMARHRRSPTAPEHPTTSEQLGYFPPQGKAWSANNAKESAGEDMRDDEHYGVKPSAAAMQRHSNGNDRNAMPPPAHVPVRKAPPAAQQQPPNGPRILTVR